MADINRRNDVGNKVLISTVAILVTVIMGASINLSRATDNKANALGLDVKEVQTVQKYVKQEISEVKETTKEIQVEQNVMHRKIDKLLANGN